MHSVELRFRARVKVVLALVVRDEADIIDAYLAYHLNAGVDLILAVDHDSSDGTTEILERYARDGVARVFREVERVIQQGGWMTHLVHLAATEEAADWVLLGDADEFWWPRSGSLKDVFAAVPDRYGVLSAPSRTFLPRPDDGRFFAERMTVRLAGDAPINDPAGPFRPVSKLAVRAHSAVIVQQGNHAIEGVPLAAFEAWHPIEIFHLPLRSSEQAAAKYSKTAAAWPTNPRGDLARARLMSAEARPFALYERVLVDDDALASGLEHGLLARDTRLRDALRSFAGLDELPAAGARFSVATDGAPPWFLASTPTITEDALYAVELAALREAHAVRSRRALDDLTSRVSALEQRSFAG